MKEKRKQNSVRVMETYIQVVESEVNQFSQENGLLLSENLSLREKNTLLREMVMILVQFIKEADSFDGEAFKQYVLTVENERLKKTLEELSNQIQLKGDFKTDGLIIMQRPEQNEDPYNSNKPIIFKK